MLEVHESQPGRGKQTCPAGGVMVVFPLLAARLDDSFAGRAGWAVRALSQCDAFGRKGLCECGTTAGAGLRSPGVAGVCVPGVHTSVWRGSMDLGEESENSFP